jgi:hypothetical protein
LARYLLIVNMTIGGVEVCAAMPQQGDSQGARYRPETSNIESPTAKQRTGARAEQPSKRSRLRADLGDTVSHVFEDQKQIWLSPLEVRLSDAEWLVPLTGITTGAILTDASLSKALPGSAHTLSATPASERWARLREGFTCGVFTLTIHASEKPGSSRPKP